MFKDKTWNAKKVNVKLIHGNKTAKSRILIEYGDRSKVWIGPATDTSKNIGGWTEVASRRQQQKKQNMPKKTRTVSRSEATPRQNASLTVHGPVHTLHLTWANKTKTISSSPTTVTIAPDELQTNPTDPKAINRNLYSPLASLNHEPTFSKGVTWLVPPKTDQERLDARIAWENRKRIAREKKMKRLIASSPLAPDRVSTPLEKIQWAVPLATKQRKRSCRKKRRLSRPHRIRAVNKTLPTACRSSFPVQLRVASAKCFLTSDMKLEGMTGAGAPRGVPAPVDNER